MEDFAELHSTPGPGAFDLGTTFGRQCLSTFQTLPAYTFKSGTVRKRPRAREPKLLGGVSSFGTQALSRCRTSPSSSLAFRELFGSHFHQSESPGYSEAFSNIGKGGSFSFGGAQRSKVGTSADTPGPGQYSVLVGRSSPKYSFGGRPVSSFGESVGPGPGAYSVKKHPKLRNAPRFTLKSRNGVSEDSANSPGPVYAFPSTLKKTGGGRFPKSKRPGLGAEGKSLPACGPGSYSIPPALGKQPESTKPSLPRFTFGCSERPGPDGRTSRQLRSKRLCRGTPGPGAYDPPSTFGPQAKSRASSLAGRENFGDYYYAMKRSVC